jgi:site-specific DNA recombinase
MEENRKHQRERQDGPKYLLSGLLICGECGSAYCSRRQGSSQLPYYRCIGADKYRRAGRSICDNTSVKGEPLESHVWSDLCGLLGDPDRLQAELERRRQESSPTETKLAKQQSRVNDLRGRLDRLIDAYASGLLESPEFETRIGPLRAQHDREVATLASQRGEFAEALDPSAATTALAALARQVGQNLESASSGLKRELLTLLVKRIEIHRDEIRIVYKVPHTPFVPGPDKRGKLQHRLQCQDVATGASPWYVG